MLSIQVTTAGLTTGRSVDMHEIRGSCARLITDYSQLYILMQLDGILASIRSILISIQTQYSYMTVRSLYTLILSTDTIVEYRMTLLGAVYWPGFTAYQSICVGILLSLYYDSYLQSIAHDEKDPYSGIILLAYKVAHIGRAMFQVILLIVPISIFIDLLVTKSYRLGHIGVQKYVATDYYYVLQDTVCSYDYIYVLTCSQSL